MRKNELLLAAIVGKSDGRIQILDDLKKTRNYVYLKDAIEDRHRWRMEFRIAV